MKLFVISDIHGYHDLMIKALDDAGYDKNNPEHFLVCCGDAMDRGNQPKEVLEFLLSIPEDRRVLIKGNHEWLYEDIMKRKYLRSHDYHNGADITFTTLTGVKDPDHAVIAMYNCELYKSYMNSLVNYFETEKYVFVHGWIPTDLWVDNFTDWRDVPDTCWSNSDFGATWENGMEAWDAGIRDSKGKTIVCGHYHTSWGWRYLRNACTEFGEDAIFDPFIDDQIIAIDACTAYSGKVNCVVLEDELLKE